MNSSLVLFHPLTGYYNSQLNRYARVDYNVSMPQFYLNRHDA